MEVFKTRQRLFNRLSSSIIPPAPSASPKKALDRRIGPNLFLARMGKMPVSCGLQSHTHSKQHRVSGGWLSQLCAGVSASQLPSPRSRKSGQLPITEHRENRLLEERFVLPNGLRHYSRVNSCSGTEDSSHSIEQKASADDKRKGSPLTCFLPQDPLQNSFYCDPTILLTHTSLNNSHDSFFSQ